MRQADGIVRKGSKGAVGEVGEAAVARRQKDGSASRGLSRSGTAGSCV
jgi:hypothetical protein